MAVSSVDTLSGPYTTNGVTTTFPFTFKAMAEGEVRVFRIASTGIETEISSGSYDVALGEDGGSVVFSEAPSVGDPLYIGTDPDFTQQITFENQGAFLPEVMNEAFDRAAIRDLAIKRDVDRSIRVPLGEESAVLPPIADRSLKFLGFDADGLPIATAAVVDLIANAALGIDVGEEDMGTYTGSTIPDNETVKQNIQSLETAVEARIMAFDTVADMVASTSVFIGQSVRTLGYFSVGDGGAAQYYITEATGAVPDGYGDHILTGGLYARLDHSGVLRGEWFGCVGGLESSARLNALNAYAIIVRALPGFNAVTVTQDTYVTIKDPVVFGTGSTTSGDLIQYHIKLSGRIFVVAGGALESDPTNYALTFAGFDGSRLELPFMRMNYYCNGVRIAGYLRGMVSGGSVSRAAETAIDVSGTCSGTNFYSLRAYQRSGSDDQSLLTGYSLTVDTEDVAFYGGQIGIAKWPIWIYGTASGVHFIRVHVHNGSTTHSRVDVVTVVNDGVFNIRFENAYFDDGYVVDRAGSLGITNCLHFYNSAWATLTHPLMRVNVGTGSALTTVIDDYRGTIGHYSGGDYMVLDALSNGSATATVTYTDGSSRASMGGNTVSIPYPKPTETEAVVQEYYQWYNIGTASHYPLRWINRYGSGGSEFVSVWDWDKDTVRIRTPSRGTATPGFFLGGGFIGMGADNSQADLLLGSASAFRWRINNTSGSLIPEVDNTSFVGTQTNRASRMYANRFYLGGGTTFITSGAGTPEGSVTAPIGTMYTRTDGGAGTTLYIKESGTGNTGWVAK